MTGATTSEGVVPPGGVVGILGGGQLGRMLAMAAAQLGLRTVVLEPGDAPPAADVCWRHIAADYADTVALDALADLADVVTAEFENVPAATLQALAGKVIVRPGAEAFEIAQDRLSEKSFFAGLELETAPFAPVSTLEDLHAALATIGMPAILKTRRLGYDGKGQVRIGAADEAEAAWRAVGTQPAILEGFVAFAAEASVIIARAADGSIAAYDVTENEHRGGILHTSAVPARNLPAGAADRAVDAAEAVAAQLDYVGVLALETFITQDGRVIANEMAPRVHNSGHWTLDGCVVSQFEQQIRAVCGWPLGDPARHSDAVMTNLLGTEPEAWQAIAAEPQTAVHLYGKREARPGRKMGHVTRLL